MKEGRSLTDLAAELERQAAARHDYRADTRELAMLNGHELSISGQGEFPIGDLAHRQIATHLDIPAKYYDRLRAEQPQLLDSNVNTLLRAKPSQRLVRTLDGTARAFLSNRYRRLDNDELANAILPVLAEIPDVQFPSCQVTDSHLYIKAIAPRVTAEVKVGDVVQAGVLIKNSEVGLGSLSIERLTFRLICQNGAVVGDAVRRYHVGRAENNGGDESAYEVFKDETLRADDRAFWFKVRDVTQAAVSAEGFERTVRRLREASSSSEIEDPSHGVEELGNRFQLTERECTSVLRFLTTGGDLTQYGLLNAVTRAAQDVESYDRSVELETIGGQILDLSPTEWRTVAVAA